MISRLVEHENFWLAEDDLGNGHTHAPATGEVFGWDGQIRLLEANTCQDLDGLRFSFICLDMLETVEYHL
jgi:hypothetical protein